MLVLFSTRGDLERALASGTVPRHHEHILLSLDQPARIAGDFLHELAHVFAFDIVPASARTDFPRWMHEGLAEFERGEWAEAATALYGGNGRGRGAGQIRGVGRAGAVAGVRG